MKFFRVLLLLIASVFQTVLLKVNFYIYPSNEKITFIKTTFFSFFMIACSFISFLILIKLVSRAFFYFIEQDADTSVEIMENCITESFLILLIYNIFCLILHQNDLPKYEQIILGYSITGEGALNYLFLGVIAILQSLYSNVSYIRKLKVKLSVLDFLGRQFLITFLLILPYFKNFLAYFGRL